MPRTPTAAALRGARTTIVCLALLAALAPVASAGEPVASNAAAARLRPATPQLIDDAESSGRIAHADATLYRAWALIRPDAVPSEFVSTTPWDGTLAMLQVRAELARIPAARMTSALRDAAERIDTTCPGSTGSLPNTKSTNHFYLKYRSAAIAGGLTIGQYAAALETTWKTEIGTFGWARPPKDPVNTPPGGRYLVRLDALGSGLYGYVTGTYYAGNNPATGWNDKDSVASCMVLNQDFTGFPSGPTDSLRATVAHEFNHSIQFGYGALTGFGNVKDVFVEGGASWMEDEVFDGADDNYYYLWPTFTEPMAQYEPSFPYPYWVVFRAMTERYGTGVKGGGENVMQFFWEQLSKGTSTNLAAMGKAFKHEGTTLGKAYHDAAIALRFNVDCSVTKPKWCLEEGPNYVALAGANTSTAPSVATIGDPAYSGRVFNDYALDWIVVPENQGLFNLTVNATTGGGKLRTSVVCRAGSLVTTLAPTQVAAGSTNAAFTALDPTGCDAVVVVITNENQTGASPSGTSNANYTLKTTPSI
ncbi:MAG: hypothetical protein ABI572_08735 [Actinomycetota bacterium]